jgi:hypothetical protein
MATIKKTVKKAQDGRTLKPNYSNIKGTGWESLKTPTSKDSSDYREGFDTKLKGEDIKQYPSPSGAKIRGYNEASKRNQEIIDQKTAKSLKEKEKNSYSNERANKVVGKTPEMKKGGKVMLKRKDGSKSPRGLWDNIRAAKGSGKKPTAQMLKQEKKIKAKTK